MNKIINKKLSDIFVFPNGSKAIYSYGYIPIYGGNGILGYSNKSNYDNVLIIGRVGDYCGSIYKSDISYWISDNAIVEIHKSITCHKFNYYLIKSLNLGKQDENKRPLLSCIFTWLKPAVNMGEVYA